MGRKRVRQHVNPLKRRYLEPIELPDWSSVFPDPERPLWLDVGCARGRFLLEMARLYPQWNFLGLEIRSALVAEALARRDREGLWNLHYLYANALVHLDPILVSLPSGAVRRVSFLFPDPWPKKRHLKRRVIQQATVGVLARHLPPGARVYLATDVEAVAQDACQAFAAHGAFEREGGWWESFPFPVVSEREVSVRRLGRRVWRAVFRRREG